MIRLLVPPGRLLQRGGHFLGLPVRDAIIKLSPFLFCRAAFGTMAIVVATMDVGWDSSILETQFYSFSL